MKKITLNENRLKQIVKEATLRALNEMKNFGDDPEMLTVPHDYLGRKGAEDSYQAGDELTEALDDLQNEDAIESYDFDGDVAKITLPEDGDKEYVKEQLKDKGFEEERDFEFEPDYDQMADDEAE